MQCYKKRILVSKCLVCSFTLNINYNYFVSLILATYHVQALDASVLANGSISLTCFFAEGSSADGCLVKFTNQYNECWEQHLLKNLEEHFVTRYVTIPNGRYHTISAYDIVNGTASNMISINYSIELIVDVQNNYSTSFYYLNAPTTMSGKFVNHSLSFMQCIFSFIHNCVIIDSLRISSTLIEQSVLNSDLFMPTTTTSLEESGESYCIINISSYLPHCS